MIEREVKLSACEVFELSGFERPRYVLGELNDAVVAERWLRDWATRTDSGQAAFAPGELAALERAAAQRARSRWPKAWKHVNTAAPAG